MGEARVHNKAVGFTPIPHQSKTNSERMGGGGGAIYMTLYVLSILERTLEYPL